MILLLKKKPPVKGASGMENSAGPEACRITFMT